MEVLYQNLFNIELGHVAMWAIGGLLIYLAIAKKMEPTLLLPMGFGAILVNLPLMEAGTGVQHVLDTLFSIGIEGAELFPLMLFIGIGAMIDFQPLLTNPKLMIFGAAAQFGIFFTLAAASLLGFEIEDAASIAIIGAADGPTSIFVATELGSKYLGAIMVAAYSYMALVPLVQPPIIKLCTTKAERKIKMQYKGKPVSKLTKILFPIVVTVIVGLVAPDAVALIGFLIERVAYKPLRSAPRMSVMISAIGVSYLLQSTAQMIFGSAPKMVMVGENLGSLTLGGLKIQVYTVITLISSVVIMVILSLFVKYSKTGRAMIAVSEDRDAAQLMGINVNGIITITFAIGSSLAALAGLFYLLKSPSVSFTMGAMPGIKAFTAAVIGGIGSLPGAMLGGVLGRGAKNLLECVFGLPEAFLGRRANGQNRHRCFSEACLPKGKARFGLSVC